MSPQHHKKRPKGVHCRRVCIKLSLIFLILLEIIYCISFVNNLRKVTRVAMESSNATKRMEHALTVMENAKNRAAVRETWTR
jgi:hypothetical protein